MIGKNWIILATDIPDKSTHSPDDMGELRHNGTVGDLIWFIKEGRMLAVATFVSATADQVSYNKFYDLTDCELTPTIPILTTTVTSYYEVNNWQWGAYVEYVYICRYRKITE